MFIPAAKGIFLIRKKSSSRKYAEINANVRELPRNMTLKKNLYIYVKYIYF